MSDNTRAEGECIIILARLNNNENQLLWDTLSHCPRWGWLGCVGVPLGLPQWDFQKFSPPQLNSLPPQWNQWNCEKSLPPQWNFEISSLHPNGNVYLSGCTPMKTPMKFRIPSFRPMQFWYVISLGCTPMKFWKVYLLGCTPTKILLVVVHPNANFAPVGGSETGCFV